MTFVSLAVGVPYVLLLWASGLRKAPKLNPGWWKILMPIGAAHALGHAGAVIALGAGAVSFAQTVKAAEPVFTCVLSYLCWAPSSSGQSTPPSSPSSPASPSLRS